MSPFFMWLELALLAALCESLKDLFIKKGLQSVQALEAAWIASAVSFPILLVFFILTDHVPSLGTQFGSALVIGGSLNILAFIQFMRALRASDLSLTIPFITFTPLFLLFTSPVLVGEFPKPLSVVGIFVIVTGAYVLHIQEVHQGFWAPFQAIAKEKGARRMLSVAFIYSISSNFDKIGVQNSSPVFWSLSINAFMAAGLSIILLMRPTRSMQRQGTQRHVFLLIGLFQAMTLIFHNLALNLGSVPSVIAVKRMSVLFAVVWGYAILRETSLRERLGGALLMLSGMGLLGIGEGE